MSNSSQRYDNAYHSIDRYDIVSEEKIQNPRDSPRKPPIGGVKIFPGAQLKQTSNLDEYNGSNIPTTDLPLSTNDIDVIADRQSNQRVQQSQKSNQYILPFGPEGPKNKAAIIKRGWIYKKGSHFFSSWHPKWAVLSQELPNGTVLPNGEIVKQPGRFEVNDLDSPKRAVLSLYDERSHADANIPAKHIITLNDTDEIDEIDQVRDRRRCAWSLQTDDKRFIFSTFSMLEKSDWVQVLKKVRNMYWHKDQSRQNKISNPSAPLKQDMDQHSEKNGSNVSDQVLSTQPLSIVIPPLSTSQRNPDAKEFYWNDQVPILEDKDIELILLNQPSSPYALVTPPDTHARWKQEKWSEMYQMYQKWQIDQCNASYLKFMEKLADFKAAAIFFAKKLVDDIHAKPLSSDHRMERLRIGEMTIKFSAEYRLGIDVQIGEKKLEHQVKNGQALHHTSSQLFSKLIWLIDYKGFRLEASVSSGSKDEHLLFNVGRGEDSGTFNETCMDMLNDVGQEMHLKPYKFPSYDNSIEYQIGCSQYVKVYRDTQGQRCYIHNLEHMLPCDASAIEESSVINRAGDELNYNSDSSYSSTTIYNNYHRLRPEWLRLLSFPVPVDAMERQRSNACVYSIQDDVDIRRYTLPELTEEEYRSWMNASIILKEQQCQLLARKLDRLDMIPWSSDILTEMFHIHGINMRYLGLVEEKAMLPHAKEVCMIEMIARSFKHAYKSRLRQAIFHYQQMGATKIQQELFALTADLYNELFSYQKITQSNLNSGSNGFKFVHGPLLQVMQSKFGFKFSSPNNVHPLRHLHPYSLFEAMNYHCSVVWEDKQISDFSKLSGESILGLGVKERGVIITQPPVYPYLRLNEYHGTAGLGLLMNCSSEEDLGILGSDLYFYTTYQRDGTGNNDTNGSAPNSMMNSPTTNYFNICSMPSQQHSDNSASGNSDKTTANKSISVPDNGGPYHPQCSLAFFVPPQIKYVAAVHFQSLGRLKCQPSSRSAIWFYLLAHDALFRQLSPKKALWLAKAGLCMSKPSISTKYCDVHQHYHHPEHNSTSNTQSQSDQIDMDIRLTPSGSTGGILNAQLRLLSAQAKLVLYYQRQQKDEQNDENKETSFEKESKIQAWIDLAHRELTLAVGHNHPLLMRFYQMLAGTFWFLKQWDKSVDYQKRAVEMSLRGLGKVHAWTLRAFLLLGSFCLHTGDVEQALYAFRECLQGSTQGKEISFTGINDPIFLAEVHYALSEAYLIYGDLDLALQHALQSQQMKESILGTDHPFTINSYYQVAEMALSSCQSVMSAMYRDIDSNPSNNLEEKTNNPLPLSAAHSFLWDMNKVITKNMSKNAQVALQCYEKIFQFVKYQAATQQKKSPFGNDSRFRPNNDSGDITPRRASPVRLALYTPIAKTATISQRQSTIRGTSSLSPSYGTLHKSSANTIQNQYSTLKDGRPLHHHRFFQDSIGTMCSVGQCRGISYGNSPSASMSDQEIISSQLFDLTKKLLWLSIILTTPMRRDMIRRVLKKAMIANTTSTGPGSLKNVILKLIAYSPINYLDTLVDKLDNARGEADQITETELVSIFTLLEMQHYDAIMM